MSTKHTHIRTPNTDFFHSFQILGGRGPDLDDVIVKLADLDTLSTYLRSYADFNIENFKKDRVNRVGDVGMFLSNNLREYCLNGEGNPNDEGMIVTFIFKEKRSSEEDQNRKKLESHSFLIRKDGLPEDRIRPLLEELNNQPRHHNRFVVIRDPKEEETNEPN